MKKDIILCGVGGDGIVSVAKIISDAALTLGLNVKQSEIHGMSQRGGSVFSHLRVSSDPIFADVIPEGKADIILSSEPMEALRYLPFLAPDGVVITNSDPFVNISNYPDIEKVYAELKKQPKLVCFNANAIAKELNVPIIALSQLSRNVENRGGTKRPQLSDLRESGAIEQDADVVAFIHRPEYYGLTVDENNMPTAGMAEIIIAKHRNGEVTDVPLRFIKEQAKFADADASVTATAMNDRGNYQREESYDDYSSSGFAPMGSAPSGMSGGSSGVPSEFDIAPF